MPYSPMSLVLNETNVMFRAGSNTQFPTKVNFISCKITHYTLRVVSV